MRIDVSPETRNTLIRLLDWLEDRFGETTADKTEKRVLEVYERLSASPLLGKPVVSGIDSIRKFTIHPRLIVYYRVEPERLYILHLHDTRLPPPEDV